MTPLEKIRREAERDARRYSEAMMNYGKGAGNRRKIINAEINDKKKDRNYAAEFDRALSRIDNGKVVEKIERNKSLQKTYDGARKLARTARRAGNYYSQNRRWIDDFIRFIFGF